MRWLLSQIEIWGLITDLFPTTLRFPSKPTHNFSRAVRASVRVQCLHLKIICASTIYLLSAASWIFLGLVTVRSSPTTCSSLVTAVLNLTQLSQSSYGNEG